MILIVLIENVVNFFDRLISRGVMLVTPKNGAGCALYALVVGNFCEFFAALQARRIQARSAQSPSVRRLRRANVIAFLHNQFREVSMRVSTPDLDRALPDINRESVKRLGKKQKA